MTKNKFNDAHKPKNRPKRIGLGGPTLSLDYSHKKKDGYHLSWARLDKPGEVDKRLAAWYDFVLDDDGNQIVKDAGKGAKLVLMEIKQEYYDEDFKAQQDALTERTKGLISRLNPGEYLPAGRSQVLTQTITR